MLTKILIFPFGGNGREALSALRAVNRREPTFEILGFVDDNPALLGKEAGEVKVLGGREVFSQYPEAKVLALVGNPENFRTRSEVILGLHLEESRFVSVVHPAATVAEDAHVGANTLLLANVVLSPGVVIGDHCILLANTSVGHDSSIGDFTCVGANVAVAGGVTVDQSCYVASGSVIKNGIHVAGESLIGCGSNVVEDVTASSVVAGNPARPLKGKDRQA